MNATIEDKNPKIIGITESWCNSTIMDSEIAIENYNMYRNDKNTARGTGVGVVLYIHDSLASGPCSEIDDLGFESSVWATIPLQTDEKILVGLCYRSPNSTDENNKKLRELIMSINKVNNISHILLMGDFNFPEINWISKRP